MRRVNGDPPRRTVVTVRNPGLERLDVLVGHWKLEMRDAWFLEDPATVVPGSALIAWSGDAFVTMQAELGGDPAWDFVFGRSDATDTDVALYHDERGVSRVFTMTFTGSSWTMVREDPDFHQRFVADVTADRIAGRWEASDDAGATWRKDFDLVFERTDGPTAPGAGRNVVSGG